MKKISVTFLSGSFAVALALLYVLVLRSIAVQIAPVPKPITEPYPDTSTQELCEAAGGRWVEAPSSNAAPKVRPIESAGKVAPGCQGPLAFERERDAQYDRNRQISLFVFAIGGGVAIAAALLIAQLAPVAPGLMLGAIASFFIAAVHVWTLAPGIGRLATIVVIFLILVGIGMRHPSFLNLNK